MIQAKATLIEYVDRVRQRTMVVARLVPADRIDWCPAAGAMSFGDLLRHIAVTGRWLFVEVCAGRPSGYTTHGPQLAPTKESILDLLERLNAEGLETLRSLSEEQFRARVRTPAGIDLPAWKWLRSMAEHEAHHRGQLYLMLRLSGIATPPIFGMTSEEVRQRAITACF